MPMLWLLTDARNDDRLERVLKRLPRGSGLIFRHYHLPPAQRRQRYERLRRIARARGHTVVLAGTAAQARAWRADSAYGAGQTLATAHSLAEVGAANRRGARAILLSPAFPTRSHPGAPALGPLRFRLLAQRATAPVIALGGMNRATARRLNWCRWAAIDGL